MPCCPRVATTSFTGVFGFFARIPRTAADLFTSGFFLAMSDLLSEVGWATYGSILWLVSAFDRPILRLSLLVALATPPRPQSRNPSRYVLLVGQVIVAKPLDQPWLLGQRDVHGIDDCGQGEQAQQRHGRRQDSLPKHNEKQPGDHRVADVTVDSPDHESLWWVPGGESALADCHEQPDRGDQQHESQA